MYLINKSQNRISKICEKSFNDLGFREREHLQEWLANNPEALGEELLIIQKEFDGFNDTNERLDLLALDKQGNLVIIENKLDDSGRDVTWQSLKYASYCSRLSRGQIKEIYQQYLDILCSNDNAENKLMEFFNNTDYEEIPLNQGQTQRIILVARNFRKEVTSTVLWLMNYKLRIQCIKVIPYALGEQLFLNLEQIIPLKDAEDYIISMADKTQDDINTQEELKSRHNIRLDFWKNLLKQINSQSYLFQNISPSRENWIGTSAGLSGVFYNFVITKTYGRAELYISRPNLPENKFIFDSLKNMQTNIEKTFGNNLIWERLDHQKASRIKIELADVNVFSKNDWPRMIDFMIDNMVKLEKTFKEPLKEISQLLKTKDN